MLLSYLNTTLINVKMSIVIAKDLEVKGEELLRIIINA